jgi:hypothetical protein
VTSPTQAVTNFEFLDAPLKSLELIEVVRLENPLSKNHLKLMCVIGTNIECIRNGLQIHHHIRERIFTIATKILDQELSSIRRGVIVSEGTQIKVKGETIIEVLEIMLQKDKGGLIDENGEIIIKNIIANVEQVGVKYCEIDFTFKIDKSG